MSTQSPTAPAPDTAPPPAPAGRLDTSLDSTFAAATLFAGVVLAATAHHYNKRAFILFAGLEGSVALVILGAAVAMFGGLRGRAAILSLAPVVALQVAYLVWKGLPWMAPLGIDLAGIGAIALAGVWIRWGIRSRYGRP